MKKTLIALLVLAVAVGALSIATFGVAADSPESNGGVEKKLRHLVLFKFKEDASETDVKKVSWWMSVEIPKNLVPADYNLLSSLRCGSTNQNTKTPKNLAQVDYNLG